MPTGSEAACCDAGAGHDCRDLVLGLDIGIGSLGWCLIDDGRHEIVDMGVRLWDVPQDSKTKESLAAVRRGSRAARRTVARRAQRRTRCLALLKDAGLVPADAGKDWLQTAKGDPQPIESRAAALDGRVSDRHLAQALYNICARRGYVSHAGGGCGADEGKVLSALDENKGALEEGGWRTWAEMRVAGQGGGRFGVRTRNSAGDYSLCVGAPVLEDEAERIIAAQRALGNPAMTEAFEQAYLRCLREERSREGLDERVYSQVGPCVYFSGEKAASKACLSFEMCCAWERVSNVRTVDEDGVERRLPADVRSWCVEVLFSPAPVKGNRSCKVTYRMLRKRLGLPAGIQFKNVDDESEEVYVPRIWRAERDGKGKDRALPLGLLERMRGDLVFADAVGSALGYASSGESLKRRLEGIDLAKGEVEALLGLGFAGKAYSGYGTRSPRALEMLVDAFEDADAVHGLSEAEQACGLQEARLDRGRRGRMLPPYSDYDPACRNPVVLRAMAQVRRVVNAVIGEHGMPGTVRIELAGELKRPAREKAMIVKANVARGKARAGARARAAGLLGVSEEEVPGKVVGKVMLYDEQGGIDVYTGEPIDFPRLVTDERYCEVDHVLPVSRTCDDSQSNKVLALQSSNQEKGQRSPCEWLGGGDAWERFAERVVALGLPNRKRRNLLERDLDGKQDGFIARNLNDTRYATSQAMGYIADCLEFPCIEGRRQHVFAVAGGATSMLRHEWGFARKNRRADDCHHAVDAAIVAACSPSVVMRVARLSERRHLVDPGERSRILAEKEPWQGFCGDVQRHAGRIVPTRRVEHGATGQLYEDSTYSFVGMDGKGHVAHLSKSGKMYRKSNFVRLPDGSVKLVGKMMMLRLWWDGKRYLKEPVYYADVAAMRAGSYVPRYFPGYGKAVRSAWPQIPDEALVAGPAAVLRYGDAVRVGDEVLRFKTLDIGTASLKFAEMRCWRSGDLRPLQALGKADGAGFVRRVEEDVLGLCYRDARIDGPRVLVGGSEDQG